MKEPDPVQDQTAYYRNTGGPADFHEIATIDLGCHASLPAESGDPMVRIQFAAAIAILMRIREGCVKRITNWYEENVLIRAAHS
jgi:hypothetical protein